MNSIVNSDSQQSRAALLLSKFSFLLKPASLLVVSFLVLIAPALIPKLWFLVFVGLLPLFFALDRASEWSVWKKVLCVFLVGLGYFFVVLYPLSTLNTWWWTITSGFFWEHQRFVYLLGVLLLAMVCSMLTFVPTFSLYIYTQSNRIQTAWIKQLITIAGIPAVWIMGEYVRIQALAGLQWATFGQPLAENRIFVTMAAWGGVYTLTAIAISINTWTFLRIKSEQRTNIPGILVSILIAVVSIHAYSLTKSEKNQYSSQKIAVAIISPHLTTQELTTSEGSEHIFELLHEISNENEDAQIIFLPENVFPTLVLDENTKKPLNSGPIYDKLMDFSHQNPNKTIILGLHTTKSGNRHNSAVAIEDGRIIDIYHKQFLLPFTEKSFGFLEKIHIEPLTAGSTGETGVGETSDASAVSEQNTLSTQHATLRPLICSEVLHSMNEEKVAQILVNLSNDNIFDSERAARYNSYLARIRAIQSNTPLIRSAKGTFSGIFSTFGREVEVIEKTPEILIGFVELG